jgi:uncharacterized protein YjbJ (UPF0337 family)
MQWMDIKANWKDVQLKFQKKWTKLTEADLKAVAGKREELIKRLNKLYGTDETKLGKEIDEFVKNIEPLKV